MIKVDAPSALLHPLTVGNSDALHVGDEVVTIGSPFGLEETVTSGIVSYPPCSRSRSLFA